jgi:adenine-specific DNA-methyltransferase
MVASRRALGSYYSPEPYARALVEWALNGVSGTVLDPSYGGCAFLRVGIDALRSLGETEAESLVFGTDIDGSTAPWAAHLVSLGVPPKNLLAFDFLSLIPGAQLPLAKAVVGNPPYVRHHWIASEPLQNARSAMESAGVHLNQRANMWAYFLVHSVRHVAQGGRLAMLLPGSALNAEYARPVHEYLSKSFGAVRFVRVHERIFADAQEETVVVLAEERGSPDGTLSIKSARNLRDLTEILKSKSRPDEADLASPTTFNWRRGLIDPSALSVFDRLASSPNVRKLGDLATIRIGEVTGANDFFVKTSDQASAMDVLEMTIPVVSRSAWITAATIDAHSLGEPISRANRLLVLDKAHSPSRVLLDAIQNAELDGVHLRHHCQRDPWWSLGTPRIPDAFLPYMGGEYRGIALNQAKASSTNAVHQITWRTPLDPAEAHIVARGSWSSLTRLSVELLGRSYGGGVLKTEISSAKQALIFIPQDMPIESSSKSDTNLADSLLVQSAGISRDELGLLRTAADTLAAWRKAPKNRASRREASKVS